jgi:hypothetical protein
MFVSVGADAATRSLQTQSPSSQGERMSVRHSESSIRTGGLALLAAAFGFVAVFAYLAARFDYPDVLDAPAAAALPALLAMGATGRAVWGLYGLLPLLLIPAAVGARRALRGSDEDGMRLAMLLAVVAATAMMLGLLRWPSIQWELARAYAQAGPDGRPVIAAIFDGLNRYQGNNHGEFAGELCLNAFFLLSARAMWRGKVGPRWVAVFGLATGTLGGIAMWRNVTGLVAPAAALNNVALPLWMIVFGVTLMARPISGPPSSYNRHNDSD